MNLEKPCIVSRRRNSRSFSVWSWTRVISFCLQSQRWLPLPALLSAWGCVDHTGPVLSDAPGIPTPDQVLPVPSADQLAWQTQELTAFLHFGIDTFANQEQGDGTVSPTLFNPTGLDATQWMTTLRSAGFRQAMLTAKHHDGFCLWQTQCATTPWRRARGSRAAGTS